MGPTLRVCRGRVTGRLQRGNGGSDVIALSNSDRLMNSNHYEIEPRVSRKLKRASCVLAGKPVRSGLVVIRSWLALVLLAAVGIVGGLNSSSRQLVTNKSVSVPAIPAVPGAELVSLPAPRAQLVRLPAPRAELVRLRP